MFEPFHRVLYSVSKTVTKYAGESKRPVIGVMPAYFPMELIEAAGGYPVQLWGNNLPIGKSDAYLQSYCCSVARSVMELELSGGAEIVDAYAFTSICDTLINLREVYRKVFTKRTLEFAIPITGTKEARLTFLKSVVAKVSNGLEEITGKKITTDSLAAAARLHGKARALQRKLYSMRRSQPELIANKDFYAVMKAGFFLPREVYREMLEELIKKLEETASTKVCKGPKVFLSGMIFDPIAIYDIFDDLEMYIVDDDFANGWRTVSKGELETNDLITGISDFLFNASPCCCVYNPDNDRHEYILSKIKSSGAGGVIFLYTKFCEPDAFDLPQILGRLNKEKILNTTLDVELSMSSFDSLRTRINAFREILEG